MYLSNLSVGNLHSLGLEMGLHESTVTGYGQMAVSQFLTSLLNDWINEKDSVMEQGGATWSSLVRALKSKSVRQNGIAAKIEAEKMRG